MAKSVLPRVQVMVLCDEIEPSADEEEVFDLHGVRTFSSAPSFPSLHPQLCVYLSAGLGAAEQEVLLRHFRLPPNGPSPTVREAVRLAARLGGFLGRGGDGEPGVQCLWRGSKEWRAMSKGYRLGLQLSSP